MSKLLDNQLREILDSPATSPLANDVETKLRMLTKFINARYVPKATYDKKINGAKHKAMKHLDNNSTDRDKGGEL